MAITTINGKLAIIELEEVYEPGLPLSPGTLGQDDKQQLLHGFPEILWGAPGAPPSTSGILIMPSRAMRHMLVR
jgi:hypothetical protein